LVDGLIETWPLPPRGVIGVGGAGAGTRAPAAFAINAPVNTRIIRNPLVMVGSCEVSGCRDSRQLRAPTAWQEAGRAL
jgi:hypothetical protein